MILGVYLRSKYLKEHGFAFSTITTTNMATLSFWWLLLLARKLNHSGHQVGWFYGKSNYFIKKTSDGEEGGEGEGEEEEREE